MGYPAGNQGYYPAERSGGYRGRSGDYGSYSVRPTRPSRTDPPLPRYLLMAVAVLGLICYVLSYFLQAPDGDLNWAVRFAVLAGLLAAFDLSGGQTPVGKAVAALAAIGFLDALSGVVHGPTDSEKQLGWALTVIVVVNGLQAVAAIGALLMKSGAVTERASSSGRDPYADQYAQAAQYYSRYARQTQQPDEVRRGQAHGQAQAQTSAQAQQTQQMAVRQTQQASQYGDYAEYVGGSDRTSVVRTDTSAQPAPQRQQSAAPPGMPSYGQAQAPASGPIPQQHATETPEHRQSPPG